jgi:nucleotide-binding universal stress UspA family protein
MRRFGTEFVDLRNAACKLVVSAPRHGASPAVALAAIRKTRQVGKTMFEHILVATDGTELADKAVQHGLGLAKAVGAKLTALTVTTPFHALTADTQMLEDTPKTYKLRMQKSGDAILGKVADAAQAAGVACDTMRVEHEHPYQAIIDDAQAKGCDLIVMASHGRRGAAAILIGSETLKVLTHSKIPVLVYR